MPFRSTAFIHLCFVFALLGQTTDEVGSLRGFVTDDTGLPLAGVRVSYTRIYRSIGSVSRPVPAPGERVASGVAVSDKEGGIEVPNLPTGDFLLCANLPSAPYLDPCKWNGAKLVKVESNASEVFSVLLTKGVFLRVRTNDPKGFLPSTKDTPLAAGNLIVGVKFGSGAYQGAENIGVDANGRDYEMIIPTGMALNLWLFSRHVALTDALGSKVDTTGSLIPFEATAGKDQVFAFTVSGSITQQ